MRKRHRGWDSRWLPIAVRCGEIRGRSRVAGSVRALNDGRIEDGLAAGAVAAALSGLPSTVWELARGGDPLRATAAAGSIVLTGEVRRSRLLVAAVPVHLAMSLGWGVVLAHALPRRPTLVHGVGAGLAIAAFDLGTVGRMFPRIRSLPLGPQLADHALFGAIVARVLAGRR